MQRRAESKATRALLGSTLLIALASACDDPKQKNDPGEEAQEALRAVERTVERGGEALREKTADGSLLVESPAAPDAGDQRDH